MICGCSAVKMKFDTAVRSEACRKAFGNVWKCFEMFLNVLKCFENYEQMRHSHATKTRLRGGYFKQKIKKADAAQQTNISWERFPKLVTAE